jgi:PTH2 family peptidyl-tRNA hydrolase
MIKKQYKQVILVRDDLKMPKGKMAAQVSHASVEACFKTDKRLLSEWQGNGAKKVILKVENDKELIKYRRHASDAGLVTALIKDAGRTVLEPGTITCLAIGPDEESKIDEITGHLKLIS